jgi:hypothetical protein
VSVPSSHRGVLAQLVGFQPGSGGPGRVARGVCYRRVGGCHGGVGLRDGPVRPPFDSGHRPDVVGQPGTGSAERIRFVIIGQSSGAGLPESIEPHHFAEKSNPIGTFTRLLARGRSIPVVTLIVGPSFGSSSLYAGLSDFVVQLEGTYLAHTSPRVVEVATGERVNMEELGGRPSIRK